LFLIGTAAWFGFWLLGLPAYYRQYSFVFMVWFDALLLVPFVLVAYFMLKRRKSRGCLRFSIWPAFYFTVPLAVYDWLYCGLYLGHGLVFLTRFWYLTVYYLIPWILFPGIALVLDWRARSSREDRLSQKG
jgi:hypothetical protein